MSDTIGVSELPDVSANDELVGTRLGIYLIERFLGKGGMARVYRAKHLTLERACAIKVLRPSRNTGEGGAVESLLAEARAAAALVHPHVVTLHTIGHEGNHHFLEMEFVDGQSLAQLIRSKGPLPAPEATRLMVQTSSALAQAHHIGMIHRDIKPSNVLVTREGVAKLSDFGLAKQGVALLDSTDGRVLTGTPYFMAPELFHGEPATARSDVYAMGVMYYTLLTGRVPVSGASLNELVRAHARRTEVDVRDIVAVAGDAPSRVVEACLAPIAERRYADAGELFDELRAVYGSLRDLESLLEESLADAQVTFQGSGDKSEVSVELDGGRSQIVHVEICSGAAVSDQIVEIFSICGPVCDRYLRRALELNASIPHGSIAIQTVDGKPQFVMSNAYPRATCDPEEIRRSVLSIARHADEVEQRLTGQDCH